MGEAKAKKDALKLVSPMGQEVKTGPRRDHPVTRDGAAIPFFPTGRRCVIERIPPEEKLGLLHIPDGYQAPQQYGTLIAAGLDAIGDLEVMGINIGDTICFGKWSGVFFDWQIPGTESHKDRRRVDVIQVDDIIGCKEVAEKMFSGDLTLDRNVLEDGRQEFRFFTNAGQAADSAREADSRSTRVTGAELEKRNG